MITQIKGRLIEKSPTELVIDCNGIGYSINISLNTYSQSGDDENIKLFMLSNVQLQKIYQGKRLNFEFQRCLSRLNQMMK